MEPILYTVHYLICLFLLVVILLQAGKGADIGAAFGAGGSQTLFGPRGAATFLSKVTAVVAIGFLATSISLAQMARKKGGSGSVLEKVPYTEPAAPLEETPPVETPPEEGAKKATE